MNPHLKQCLIIAALVSIIAIAAFGAGKARASSGSDFVLDAPKTVQPSFTADCFSASGCFIVSPTVANIGYQDGSCTVHLNETGDEMSTGSISPNTSTNVTFIVPNNGQKALTFVLTSCNGEKVPGQRQRVRVLVT